MNLTDAYLYMTIHPTEVLAEVQGEAELSETGPEIKINRGVNLTDAYLYMTIHPTEVLAEVQGEAELSETGPEIKINIDYTKNSIVGVGDDYKTS